MLPFVESARTAQLEELWAGSRSVSKADTEVLARDAVINLNKLNKASTFIPHKGVYSQKKCAGSALLVN